MLRRALLLLGLCLFAAPTRAQPTARGASHARDAPRLRDALAEGALELLGAQLDRYGDMATTDFALDHHPLVVEAAVETAVVAPAPTEGPSPPAQGRRGNAWPTGEWTGCGLDGEVQPVDLHEGGLLPLRVVLASRGGRAVALVTLGRPLGGRRGMSFPEARWVEWDGERPRVWPTAGFVPDAAVVLRDRDAAVIAYAAPPLVPPPRERGVPPGEGLAELAPLLLTRIGREGQPLGSSRVIEDTEGMTLDSPLVAWAGGTAMVLGRDNPEARDDGRTEALWFLDGVGRSVRAPLVLSTHAREDDFGGPCAGLVASTSGATLTAAWAVPTGGSAGVWVRDGITLSTGLPEVPGTAPSPRARRRVAVPSHAARMLLGEGYSAPVVAPWGVMARRRARRLAGDAPLTDVVMASWPVARRVDRVFDSLWDPLPVWGRGGVIVVGMGPEASDALTGAAPVVAWSSYRAGPLRNVTIDARDMVDAVDVAVVPTERGAVVAWLTPVAGEDGLRRRLAIARLGCVLR